MNFIVLTIHVDLDKPALERGPEGVFAIIDRLVNHIQGLPFEEPVLLLEPV
jgi:hypothetical protein